MSHKSRRKKVSEEKKGNPFDKSVVMILFTLFYGHAILAILSSALMYLVSGHQVPSQGHQIIMLSKCLLLHVLELDTQSETPSLAVNCHKCQSSFLSFFSQECFLSVFHSETTKLFTGCYLCLGFQDLAMSFDNSFYLILCL